MKKKPYKYNAKSRLTPNSQSFPFKVNSIKKDVVTNLENTLTKLHIIDDSSSKKGSLDDGFFEGRVDRKVEQKKKKKKVNSRARKEKIVALLTILRKIVLSVSAVGAVLIIVMLSYHFMGDLKSHYQKSAKNRVSAGTKSSSYRVDDNFVFVGDFHTDHFSFEKYGFDYHFVKVSQMDLTTSEMLNRMKEMIYDYNPSVVFIEIGMVDMENGVSQEQFIKDYGKILDLIALNRPNAMIVVESIYPVHMELYEDSSITNQDIKKYNTALKNLALEKNVRYLDLYSRLLKTGNLNPDYTEDGITLNSKGYQVVYKEIKRVVG